LFGGYVAANFLKWIWWRFNGWGYFWGMLTGLIIASMQFILYQFKDSFDSDTLLYELSNLQAIYLFPIIFFVSLFGSFLGTFLSNPTDMQTLKSFYKSVRPWGLWQPVYQELIKEDKSIKKNSDFWKDMLNCAIGIVWQSSMIVLPIYFVIRDYPNTIIALTTFILTSIILKFTWLDKIRQIKN
jgi:hypothetical protein